MITDILYFLGFAHLPILIFYDEYVCVLYQGRFLIDLLVTESLGQ